MLAMKRHQKCKQTHNIAGVWRIKGSMWRRSKSFSSLEPRFETGSCQGVTRSLFTSVHSSLWAPAAPWLGEPSRTKNRDLQNRIINPGNLWSPNWQSDAPDVTRTSISDECFQGHLSVDGKISGPESKHCSYTWNHQHPHHDYDKRKCLVAQWGFNV